MSNHAPNRTRARVISLRPAATAAAPNPVGTAARGSGTAARGAVPRHGGEQAPAAAPTPASPVGPVTPAPAPAPREPLWRDVVGDVLRRERLAQERTLKDVAEAARISMPYLSELERGRKEASSEVLAAAAHALGLGLADLLALAQEELARVARARAGRRRAAMGPAPAVRTVSAVTSVTSMTSARAVGRPGGVPANSRYDGTCLAA